MNLSLNDLSKNLKINGIAFRDVSNVTINKPEIVVPQNRMDIGLPVVHGISCLLNLFDLYNSPIWHAEYINENRSPYAAIQLLWLCI